MTCSNKNFSRENQFQWDTEILEFLDTLEYYGHEATVHLLRGPGFYKRKSRCTSITSSDPKFMWESWNWPLPGRTTRNKEKGRYSTDSGVYWPMVQNFLSVISDAQSGCEPLFTDENPKLRIYPVTSQEDGVALKPGLQVDIHQGIIVGTKKAIDFQYICNNEFPDAEVLKNEMVKEAHCISIETLDGKFAIPVGAQYLPSAVSGSEQLEQSVASFEVLNTCLSCLKNSKMSFAGAVLKGNGHCKSECPDCEKTTENKRVCDHCQDVGHTFVEPWLRACEECITNGDECIKMVCLVWMMDSESKNKSSQITLTQKQKDEDSDVNKLVTALPDAVHVAKNDRASFANWFRLVDGYRINLVLLRTIRMDPKLKDQFMPCLQGVARLKKTVLQINPNFMQYTRVHSLLTLFVENFFSSMRAGNTTTPTMLDFCLRFPRCVNEQLKRVTANSYNYFTNPKASYYLEPKLGDISINFTDLAKLPKPAASSLAKKQKTKLRNWAMQHGKAVRQNTTRNFSTKDKPGTLPINLYEQAPPVSELVNFGSLLEDDPPANHDNPFQRNVSIFRQTYVAISKKYIPTSIPSSSLCIAKLLDDVIDGDERNRCVKALFYKQDFLDPLSFIIASEELSVSTEGIIGIVNNITAVDDDTVDINEDDYYILLTMINGSCDNISPEEYESLQESAIHADSEDEQQPHSTEANGRPKRKRNRNTNTMYFFY